MSENLKRMLQFLIDGEEIRIPIDGYNSTGGTAELSAEDKAKIASLPQVTEFMKTLNEEGIDALTVKSLLDIGDNLTTADRLKIDGLPNMTSFMKDLNEQGTSLETVKSLLEIITPTVDPNGIKPHITVDAPEGCTVTVSSGANMLTASPDENNIWEFEIPQYGIWTITCAKDGFTNKKTVFVNDLIEYRVSTAHIPRYGYRKKKTDSNPNTAIEYLYDAKGMVPAHMDFAHGMFDYGDWGNIWFVKNNKPCMVKFDGEIDYYLDPYNYNIKENGETSDVDNVNYEGNAMSLIPKVWIYRYEDNEYKYEIVCEVQYDENYEAYAFTDKNGNIKDYFLYGIFGGSLDSQNRCRSLSNKSLMRGKTREQEINFCKANGDDWYTGVWSQHQVIETLCTLISKTTGSQEAFGNGNANGSSGSESTMLPTGTLNDKGQFYGYNDNTHQVKVFHIEKFWGDQWEALAGLINYNGKIYVKMTPKGQGYRINDVTGYTNTNITPAGTSGGYISDCRYSKNGVIPTTFSGSGSTYFCDGGWYNNSIIAYLLVGACSDNASSLPGSFCFNVSCTSSAADWNVGARPSLISTAS